MQYFINTLTCLKKSICKVVPSVHLYISVGSLQVVTFYFQSCARRAAFHQVGAHFAAGGCIQLTSREIWITKFMSGSFPCLNHLLHSGYVQYCTSFASDISSSLAQDPSFSIGISIFLFIWYLRMGCLVLLVQS